MATVVMLKNPRTGIFKKGLYGFSWTTFFFGGLPALFRGELVTGLIVIVLNILTFCVAGMIWAFFYNKQYTIGLIERGYELADSEDANAMARAKLGIAPPQQRTVPNELVS